MNMEAERMGDENAVASYGNASDAGDALLRDWVAYAVLEKLRCPADLASATMTCRSWKHIINEDMWRAAYVMTYGEREPEEQVGR